MRSPCRRASFAGALAVALLSAGACRAPTQITLRLTTDVACADLKGTSIYKGSAQADSTPVTSTRDCESGASPTNIGTLVLVPSGSDKNELVTVSAVAGVDIPSADCAKVDFAGCIVARRRLRFAKHEPVELPILLSRSCVSVVCGKDETCVPCTESPCAPPRCAPAEEPNACDRPGGQCNVASASGSGSVDAGGADAGRDAPPLDAAVDAGPKLFRLAIVESTSKALSARGLAATSAKLYWTITTKLRSITLSAALSGVGAGDETNPGEPISEPLSGIDLMDFTDATWVVAAGASQVAYRDLLNFGPTLGVQVTAVAFVNDNPSTMFVGGSAPSSAVPSSWTPNGAGIVPVPGMSASPGGYAHRVAPGVVLFGAGGAIGRYAPAVSAATEDAGAGPAGRTVLGVATANGNVYVTTHPPTAPNVFVRRADGDGAWTPLGIAETGEPGFVPLAEDILAVRDLPGAPGVHLFVAGRGGIWVLEGVE